MTKLAVIVSENIVRMREDRNWSQDFLSEKLEINIRTLQRYEAAERIPPKKVLDKLASVFGVNPTVLFQTNEQDDSVVIESGLTFEDVSQIVSKIGQLNEKNRTLLLKSLDSMLLGQSIAEDKKRQAN